MGLYFGGAVSKNSRYNKVLMNALSDYLQQKSTFKFPEGVTEIAEYCFYGWTSLQSITIPSSVTRLGDSCFGSCSNLSEVTFEKPCQITDLQGFDICSSLQSITIPNSVTSLGDDCFNSCSNLSEVTFEEDCQITKIPYGCFSYCSSLESITIPSSVETIDSYCFGSSWSPNTSLTTIYVNKPQDSIAGAPWGATNATVIWNG